MLAKCRAFRNLEILIFRVEKPRSGVLLELPITRPLEFILERCRAEAERISRTGFGTFLLDDHSVQTYPGYALSQPPGYQVRQASFRFCVLLNRFIAVAVENWFFPNFLTTPLVNHAPPSDVTERYATVRKMRRPCALAQSIADRVDAWMKTDPDEATALDTLATASTVGAAFIQERYPSRVFGRA